MKILSLSDQDVALAAAALARGAVAAFPTETVYGLGGDAFNVSALARIFEIKNRPRFDPLIIHIAAIEGLDRLVLWEALGRTQREKLDLLAKHFWPGPLTLVLPKRPEVPDLATSGLPTVAVRFPAFEAAQKLIRLSTGAVAAPSANHFGCLSPTRAEHVISRLGDKVDYIIDGGPAVLGLESTVLDISSRTPRLLRYGCITREQIEALIGPVETPPAQDQSTGGGDERPSGSPGQMKSHYAPRTPLWLHHPGALATVPDLPDEGRLYFSFLPQGGGEVDSKDRIKVLSPNGDLAEAAANFFDMLHELDTLGLRLIRAEEAPSHGLGAAINDRLRRAAAAF